MHAAGEVVAEPSTLLMQAQADPRLVVELTAAVAQVPATKDACTALRARSIAFRVLGDNTQALVALEQAQAVAEQLDDPQLLGACLFSSAPLLALDGRIAAARHVLDAAGQLDADPVHQAEVEFQRGGIALLVAEWQRSFDHYSNALPTYRANNMTHHVADALLGRGLMAAYLGDRDRFEQDLTEAASLFVTHDDDIGVFQTQWNRALGLALTGDPAEAIERFTEAEPRLADAGFPVELYMGDQAEALFALGLHEEAIAQAEFCVEAYGDDVPTDDGSINVLDAASRRLELARIHSLCGSDLDALAHAERAHESFVAHGQRHRALFSETITLQCRLRTDGPAAEMTARLGSIDAELGDEQHPEWRSLPLLVAAECALSGGDVSAADRLLDQARRHDQNDVLRLASLELGVASAQVQGQHDRVLELVDVGFRIVEDRSRLEGSAWIRAVVTRKLASLVDHGLGVAAARNDAAAALKLLARSQEQLDAATRPSAGDFALGANLRCWFEAAGTMYLVATDATGRSIGGVQPLGEAAAIIGLADELTYLVRRAFRDATERRLGAVETTAQALEDALALPAYDGGVTQMHLPAGMTELPLGVLPSLRSNPWVRVDRLRGATEPPAPPNKVALVAGPGLDHAHAEVERIAHAYGAAAARIVTADKDAVLDACGTADLLHVAAHSQLNVADVMRSSIRLDDGELQLAELGELEHPPAVAVLASCESAGGAQVGVTQLGISDALLGAGVAVVIGTALAIPDCAETVALMERLHEAIRDGAVIGAPQRLRQSDSPLEDLIAGCLVTHVRAPLAAGVPAGSTVGS